MKWRIGIILGIALLTVLARPARADDIKTFALTLKNHKFTPDHIDVAAGQRFRIALTNNDMTVAELESSDMKFEKIAVAGATVTVFAGPLRPGTYKFLDDYRPGSAGTVTAK